MRVSDWMSEKRESGEVDLAVLWLELAGIILRVAESKIGFRLRKKGKRKGTRHWNEELEQMKQTRRAAWKNSRMCKTRIAREAYNRARNAGRNALRKERLAGWEKTCDEIEV